MLCTLTMSLPMAFDDVLSWIIIRQADRPAFEDRLQLLPTVICNFCALLEAVAAVVLSWLCVIVRLRVVKAVCTDGEF